ncbi:MAG: class I SAM-dependent methyltransferase [Clostridia bacterium]|nr:class I SAM-dependent methyltransferase [Clostridia bacterium]
MSEYSEYALLSEYYDRFTDDVPYERWADFFERIFEQKQVKPKIILDLACGTGSLTRILAQRGYDMIGADQSEDMLMMAQEACMDVNLENPVLLLHQPMQELDLYGSIDACVCCLDSVNYVENPEMLREAMKRVFAFLEPGGLFIFDINTRSKLERIDGQSFVREDEDVFCVWQCVIENGNLCHYDFDIFEFNEEGAWNRYQEHHVERIYEPGTLMDMLEEAGFIEIEQRGELSDEAPAEKEERIFFIARKPLK